MDEDLFIQRVSVYMNMAKRLLEERYKNVYGQVSFTIEEIVAVAAMIQKEVNGND